ncbi:SdpI family protein [Proteiniclasticum ruminis]|nr:SdpI family protein [Proteiniclasticum ruminis]MBP9920855.1 SdpI family protein [Proteiniclasticum sp.]
MMAFSLGITGLLMGTMLFFGWIFIKHPPKDINFIYGYRTPRSTKNQEVWMFAHKTAGQIWLKSGAAGAAVSILLIVLFDRYGSLERFSLYLVYIQLMLLLLVIPLTEWKISRNFNRDGSRKEGS